MLMLKMTKICKWTSEKYNHSNESISLTTSLHVHLSPLNCWSLNPFVQYATLGAPIPKSLPNIPHATLANQMCIYTLLSFKKGMCTFKSH